MNGSFPPPTPKQAHVIWFAVTALAVAICIALLAGLLWGLGNLLQLFSPVLWPLALAGVIACVLDPVVGALERRKIPRTAAILATFLSGLLVLAVFLSSVIPRLVDETGQLLARVPAYTDLIQKRATTWVATPPKQIRWLFDRRELLKAILDKPPDA